MLPQQWFAHLALFGVALIYGLNYVIAKDVMAKGILSPFQFILLRVIVGTILFWIFYRVFINEKIRKEDFRRIAWCGLTGVAINQLCFFAGLNYTTPIHAALLMTMVPILVLLFAHFILRERVRISRILGVLLGIIGAVYLITMGGKVNVDPLTLKGDMLILTNATSYGLYLVLVKDLMKKYNPITIITWVFTAGMVMVLPFGLPGIHDVAWSMLTGIDWMAIGYVLIFTTFLAYLFNAFALSRVSAATVSVYIYLQPIIASASSIWLGKEVLEKSMILAALLIFVGVYLVSKRDNRDIFSSGPRKIANR